MNKSILISVVVLLFSGCTAPTTYVAADQQYFDAACDRIKMTPEDVLRKRYVYSIDTSATSFGKPMDGVHHRSLEKVYLIDVPSYVRYVSERLLPRNAAKIRIDAIDVEVGDNGVMAEVAPVFFVKVRGRDSAGREFLIEKGASGPAVGNFQRSSNVSKKTIESANIAFMAAFLQIVVAIENQLESRVDQVKPNQALLPTPMSVTPAANAPVAPATGAADL